jgi:hypothetical protein
LVKHSTIHTLELSTAMKYLKFGLLSLVLSHLVATLGCSLASADDFASACYQSPLPSISPSTANRTIPWDNPRIKNGSMTCCSSLGEVRAEIDRVDAQLLQLLSKR